MKNILLISLISLALSCNAQTYPLRNFSDIPENSYEKDTNNELPAYEGIWKGSWNNKTIYVSIKKITNKYSNTLKYYTDCLIAKFKVTDSNGLIIFDNTNLSDDQAKIKGGI